MEKYKRFTKVINENDIQEFFNELTTEGWQIIYYNEKEELTNMLDNRLNIIVICKKVETQIL